MTHIKPSGWMRSFYHRASQFSMKLKVSRWREKSLSTHNFSLIYRVFGWAFLLCREIFSYIMNLNALWQNHHLCQFILFEAKKIKYCTSFLSVFDANLPTIHRIVGSNIFQCSLVKRCPEVNFIGRIAFWKINTYWTVSTVQ